MAKQKNRKNPRGLRKREGNWHYRIVVNGHEYSGNTQLAATVQNLNDALKKRAEIRTRILRGNSSEPEIIPFSKAAGEFLDWCDGEYRQHPNSALRIRTSFASLVRYFRNEPVLNIGVTHLEQYKTFRRKSHIREVTIRHDLHALSVFFRYAMKHGWARENPVRDDAFEIPSDADAVRMYVLHAEEETRYFEAAGKINSNLFDVARIMILQGCRPEEVMGLEQSAVDLRRNKLHITRGKSKAAKRSLRMVPEVAEILARRLRRPGMWVFPSSRYEGQHITKLINPHNKACYQADLEIVMYDLRHTWASRMALAGCPLPQLAALMGHGSLRSVQKYIHVSQDDMDRAVERYGNSKGNKSMDGMSTSRDNGVNEAKLRTVRPIRA